MDLGWCDLCLNVHDIDRSQAFYESLGFRIVEGTAESGYLLMTNDRLRIALCEGHINSNMINFRGGNVEMIVDQLQSKGIEIESGPTIEDDGSVGATVKDPDGNVIYFNTAPGETMQK